MDDRLANRVALVRLRIVCENATCSKRASWRPTKRTSRLFIVDVLQFEVRHVDAPQRAVLLLSVGEPPRAGIPVV